jgi:hypothetical protein
VGKGCLAIPQEVGGLSEIGVSQNTAGPSRIRCRRGSGGRGNSVRRQTLYLGVAALGFRLRSPQRDTDCRGEIIYFSLRAYRRLQMSLKEGHAWTRCRLPCGFFFPLLKWASPRGPYALFNSSLPPFPRTLCVAGARCLDAPPCSPDRMRENYSSAACPLHCQVIVKWPRYRIVSRCIVKRLKQGLTQRRDIVKHGTPRLLPSMYRDAVRN